MEMEYLKEFIVMSKCEDLFDASEQLYISPSTLSRHIKMIEDQMKTKLFERTSRNMKLNQQGEIFLSYAKNITQMEENYKSNVYRETTANERILKIATISSVGDELLANAVGQLKKRHPDFKAHVHLADTIENWEHIRKRECDFAFVLEHMSEYVGVKRLCLGTEQIVVVLRKDHPLASNKKINIALLAREKLLLFYKESYMYTLIQTVFRKENYRPRIAATAHEVRTLVGLAESGMGVAVMTEGEIRKYKDRIAWAPIEPEINVSVNLVYNQKQQSRKIENEFLNCIKDTKW